MTERHDVDGFYRLTEYERLLTFLVLFAFLGAAVLEPDLHLAF